MTIPKITAALFAAAALTLSLSGHAHGGHEDNGPGKEKVTLLERQALPDVPGKFGLMVSVTYAPGQESVPHSHPGSVFVYVVEGEVQSQLDNGKLVTYKAGQSWYEAPGAVHSASRNASKTKPARLVAWMMADEAGEVVVPLKK